MIWINADDFGFNKSITEAIILSFENGYLSSTSACSNGEYFEEAARLIKQTQFRDKVGLHVNLTEGKPLTEGIKRNKYICQDGMFIGFPKRNHLFNKQERAAIYDEIKAQINLFKKSGLSIHHLDSHHHIHNSPGILPIFLRVMNEEKINKLRLFRNAGKISFLKRILKYLFNLRISKYAYSKYMGSYEDLRVDYDKAKKHTYELMIHPDFDSKQELIDRENGDYNHPNGIGLANIIRDINEKKLIIMEK